MIRKLLTAVAWVLGIATALGLIAAGFYWLNTIESAGAARFDHRKNVALERANYVCGKQGARKIYLHIHYEFIDVTCRDWTVRTVPL